MNWMVYFIGGSRDLQKHAWPSQPRARYESPMLERMALPPTDVRDVDTINYKREVYSFRAIRMGLGIYIHEETL